MDNLDGVIVGGIIGVVAAIGGSIAGATVQHHLSAKSNLAEELRIRYAAWLASVQAVSTHKGTFWAVSHMQVDESSRWMARDAWANLCRATELLENEALRLLVLENRPGWVRRIETLTWSVRESTWHDDLGPNPGAQPLESLRRGWQGAVERFRGDLVERHPVLSVPVDDT